MGFRVWDLGFRVLKGLGRLGFKVQGSSGLGSSKLRDLFQAPEPEPSTLRVEASKMLAGNPNFLHANPKPNSPYPQPVWGGSSDVRSYRDRQAASGKPAQRRDVGLRGEKRRLASNPYIP